MTLSRSPTETNETTPISVDECTRSASTICPAIAKAKKNRSNHRMPIALHGVMAESDDELVAQIARTGLAKVNKSSKDKYTDDLDKRLKAVERKWEKKLHKAIVGSVGELSSRMKGFDIEKYISENIE
ncbi:hypothetical protein BWQ96_10325 [Gracilariopsis chorda]|uniref:Uncharacterized protein n=1 Tax=Gracilariopsis chorda TaxID=448386 RepID=A0A2V3ID17_9FLOR|nr:hypothetical protein BWQ96_10325 [Gracilariopsis chorda]|eukprot:PXF39974.1 hypothetical protein BWQ96_10325 [Gracilariopsis chorda]